MKAYMYLLECVDGTYYSGCTKYLVRRFQQHQNGLGANQIKRRLPVKLVYYEEFQCIDEASCREKQIHEWSRKKKQALIEAMPERLYEFVKSLNETTQLGYVTSTMLRNQLT